MPTQTLPRPSSLLLVLAALALAAHALAQEPASPAPASGGTQEPGAPAAPSSQGRGGADPSEDAVRMGSPPSLPVQSEEEMWPAATAEGWKQPCLVRWQRTFDDALKVARAEHRPILVAVNMDGEIASEHHAGVRYREPETAALMSRYACVIASVYRHTPRDYDEEGRRVECPRFGTVTCGEHIEAERELYDKYFDGTRVAPRHIVLDLDGKETYDVYYSWNTEAVFVTFRKGVEGWPDPLEPAERSLPDLLKSADIEDRLEVERAFAEGDTETRRMLLVSLIEERVVDQVEVLRAAIFGLDLELARLARQALARCETDAALELMAAVLKTPLEESERGMLLAAVERIGATSMRARTLSALHSGLSRGSRHIAAEPAELAREYEASARAALDFQARAQAAEARPKDPAALLDLAEALLARAWSAAEPRYTGLLLEDARAAAREAEALGASGTRLDALVAVSAAELGDWETARTRALAAVEAGLLAASGPEPSGAGAGAWVPTGRLRARVLQVFAHARQRAIRAAFRAEEPWPPEWFSDVNAAYTLLVQDPFVEADTLVEFHDFLRWIGATERANTVLEDALARFPDSGVLHERLRARLLWEGGPAGLERGYAERLAREEGAEAAATQLCWFAGYASLVAAEHHRRRGEFEQALAAYDRGIEHYRRTGELFPDERDGCQHFMAMGHAGRARVALEQSDLAAATSELRAALTLRPASAATQDGLGITPVQTARMLQSKLAEAGDSERATEVEAALGALDPKLLEPPPTELPGAGRRAGR